MPITITVHESGQYFVSKYEGRITNEELIPTYATFYANNDLQTTLPELADISSADFSQISHLGVTKLAHWAERFYQQRKVSTKKTAIYNPWSSRKVEAIIYEVWTDASPETVRTFSSLEEAVSWLTE